MRRPIKILVTAAAFVPALILILNLANVIPETEAVKAARIFNFPATRLTSLLFPFNSDRGFPLFFFGVMMCVWSAVVAIVIRKIISLFPGEEETMGQKLDWVGYRVRFLFGFIIGILMGWRFVRYSDPHTILAAMIISGIVGGLILGAYKEDFWARPL